MRKIKLMALLLATLMIVSAFVGCAGVKKEELDALDVRVQALEDLLNGQQKALEEIKNDVKAGTDNSEVLDAIESIKTDLEDKIKDVNGRIDDEVGKVDTPTASVSDETKAAQQKALALIEVRRAEFSKVADDYADEDYVKISEALGTATGAVNAATTVDAVNAAMAALDAELDKYMSYAMKAYDYYTQLLGGVNADAEELVDEAKAFLKTVKAVYDSKTQVDFVGKINGVSTKLADEHIAKVAYLVSEGTKEERDEYIDIYTAIDDLCFLYSAKSGAKTIPYVENGKIKYESLSTLYEYTAEAEALVEEIEDTIGENLVYGTTVYNDFKDLYADYEEYVEEAVLLGGEALVALVTNSSELVAAEETHKLIEEAAADFDTATRISAGKYGNVFYYYTELLRTGNEDVLEYKNSKGETIWVADYYAAVEDTLESWKGDLSDENVEAIIKAKKNEFEKDGTTPKLPSTFTYTQTRTGESYIKDKHHNDLLVAALNQFKDEIAPKIVALNDYDEASIDMVLAYDEVEELFADLVVLQKATTDKEVKYPNNEGLKLDVDNLRIIVREADIFDDYTEARLDVALANTNIDTYTKTNGLINLYTFEADIDQLDDATPSVVYFEDKNDNDKFDAGDIDNRAQGDIYKFLTSTYNTIKGLAKAINNEIAALEDNVELFGLSDNLKFITLEGKYKELENAEEFKSNGHLFTATSDDLNGSAAGTGIYVALEDIDWNAKDGAGADITDKVALDNYLTNLAKKTSTVTIEAFIHVYPEFKDMLNLDEFEAAKKAMEDRMVALFELADQFVDELEAVDYVHNNAVIYKDGYDVSGNYDPDLDNGEADFDDAGNLLEMTLATPTYLVSLGDKADVEVAYKSYTKWAEEGGALSQAIFSAYSDNTNDYDDVYYMKGFTAAQFANVKYATNKIVTLKTQLEKLEGVANNFVKAVNNIKAVDAANPFVVNKYSAQNHLSTLPTLSADNATKYRSYFAWTNFERRDTEYNRYDGTYSYVKTNGHETGSVSVSTGTKGDSDVNVVTKMTFTTKAQLITAAMNLYNNFYNAHIDYIPDADNDYESGAKVYYQATEYVAHAAFDKAAEEYAKYDLLNVKSYLYDILSDSNDVEKKLEDSITSADSMTKIENLIISRINEQGINIKTLLGGDATAIQARSVLYDFDRLATELSR